MLGRTLRRRFGIAVRLYGVLACALSVVVALTAVSIHFARQTDQLTRLFGTEALPTARLTANIRFLVGEHRRVLTSSVTTFDPAQMQAVHEHLHDIESRLRKVDAELGVGPVAVIAGPAAVRGSLYLSGLFDASERTLLPLDQGDPALAATVLDGSYVVYSDRIMSDLVGLQERSLKRTEEQVGQLLASAGSTVHAALICLGTALLTGLTGLLVVRRVVHRMAGVTGAMRALAGGKLDVSVPFADATDEIGELSRASGVFRANALEMVRRGDELSLATRQLQAAIGSMSQGLLMFDADWRLALSNDRFYAMSGFDRALIGKGTHYVDLIKQSFKHGGYPGRSLEDVVAERCAFVARGVSERRLLRLSKGATGLIFHEPMPDGGWTMTVEDVTERLQAEERIVFMARHDALTGLCNRVLFQERAEQALSQVVRMGGFALHCLDLDGFKTVNDTLGHPVGDRLLQAVAERLRGLTREGDTVARLGGDEFAIVQLAVDQARDATALAERTIAAIARPFEIDGQQIVIGTSIGIAMAPNNGGDVDSLLRNADLALYRAKAEGRRTWRFFEPEMNAFAQARRALETDLRLALAHEHLAVHYQPIVNAATGRITGFEALLRWTHPSRGPVSPAEFIAVAEDVGLIVPMGAWVLRQACREAACWPEGVRVAVNLSPVQFRSPHLVRTVTEALSEAGLAPERLELEVTELVLMQDNAAILDVMRELSAIGVQIALDDFGTGYSSLSYLCRFPFGKIKIDQSFIRDLTVRAQAAAIVRTVIDLARSLGMTTTAEGVETEDQRARLTAKGCTELQGFLFSRPCPSAEIPALLARMHAGQEQLAA